MRAVSQFLRIFTTGIRASLWRTALVLLFFAPGFAQVPQSDVTAFVSVNVVPMETDRVLHNQTVLVANGKIVSLGPSLSVPKGATVVDGHGSAFLSPGLADMHSHSDTGTDLKVYLANGVTSILNMGGASYGFIARTRPMVNDGKIPGPHVYAGFLVDGSPQYGHFFVTTADEARSVVRLAKTNGYDFIKVYNDLSAECFQALIDEGKLENMPVVGHGVRDVGLKRQLDAGQIMVAHTEEFLYSVFFDPHHVPADIAPDPRTIPDVIAFVKHDQAYVTADLNTYATMARQWGKPEVVDDILRKPEIRYLTPQDRSAWAHGSYAARKGSIDARLAFLRQFTKAMSDAGVPLIAGTDAPVIPGLLPGYSLQDDLHTLEEAGLSRYQALSTATRTPGEFVHRAIPDAEPFGTITPGNRADLILTAQNPLDDLSQLRKPLGVMAKGKWYPAADLNALLDSVAKAYGSALSHN